MYLKCGPMITSILIKQIFKVYNTLLIFIPKYIPSNKLTEFKYVLDIYSTKVVVMLVGRRYCTHAQRELCFTKIPDL